MSPSLLKRQIGIRRPSLPKRAAGGGTRRIVGLKVGASQLSAAVVENNGVPTLSQLAREPLAPGIVVGGELREPLALAEALKSFFKKNRLPTSGIRIGIANNRIGVRTFELPQVEAKLLDNAIRFRAQEALPIPVEEAVLDYHILDERFGEPEPRVMLVVTYRELIDGFAGACRGAGLSLAGIDLEAFGLLRALAPATDADEPRRGTALVAVAIGHDRSTVAISSGRVCELTRVIDWGGAKLDQAIAQALKLPAHEATETKQSLSLDREQSSEDGPSAAHGAVTRELHGFARQLVSSLHFYQGQPGALEIGEIVITGGTSQLPGLAAELERLVGAPVRVGDPLARVKLGKKLVAGEQVGSHAVAIGLGIED